MDIVQRKLFINNTSETEPITQLLPHEYQQVSYIESTGKQRINTNYLVDAADKPYSVEVKFQLTGSTGKTMRRIFGADTELGGANYHNSFWVGTTLWSDRWAFARFDGNNGGSFVYFGKVDKEIHTIKYVYNEGIYYDGVLQENTVAAAQREAVPMLNIYLFTASSKGTNPFVGRVFEFVISNENAPIYNATPCYHKTNGIIGLYDTCNSVNPTTNTPFYINAGTGTFLKGDDV